MSRPAGTVLACKRCSDKFTRKPGTRRLYCEMCKPPQVVVTPTRGAAPVPELPVDPPAPVRRPPGAVELAVLGELEAVKRLATVSGQLAIRIAHQIDEEVLSGSAVGTLGAQLERTMDRAKAGAQPAPDSLDAFAERIRELRRQSGAA